ncbi:MAG: DUF6063 family protein [Dehalobacter sp.]|nr:DUF6063 family protein [Dehalobacter sp.]
MSHLNTAVKIFKKLMDKGQFDRETDGDLFLEFRNTEVRSILAELEDEMDFRIVEASSTLYLVPDSGNSLLGFTTRDFREWVASDARLVDAYLLCYISMFILYLFYGSRNRNPKQREFLRISKLIGELDRRFAMAFENSEQAAVLDEKYAINFARVAELWESKQDFEEKSRKTKAGTILSACRLLERENLLRLVDDDREIRTTRKLDDLMLNYYLNDSRVDEINGLFEGGA